MRITADFIDEEPYTNHQLPVKAFTADDSLPTLTRETVRKANDNVYQFQKVHEMTQQFKNLHVSDVFHPIAKMSNFTLHKNASSKEMEKADGDIAKKSNDFETVPTWLIQYLGKMKDEIKKEVVEELLAQGEFQIPRGVIATRLDENHSCFSGEVVHDGIFCDNCDQMIHGIRYKCGNCSDFDLCQECESLPNIHNKNHVFLKIRYPIALKLYQKQKWHELMSSTPGKIYAMSSRKDHNKKLYEAKFICDKTVPDGTVLAPSTRFVKSWKVMNSGTRVWTHATKLHLIQGSADLTPAEEQVDVPHLKPGEEGIISVVFTSPSAPGVYRSHWNFYHKSRPFGDIVWCHIVVKSEKEESAKNMENEDLQGKSDMPHANVDCDQEVDNQRKEITCIAQVLTAVKEKHDRGNIVPRKLAVNSHTATPNNTPFDLTPPKSPDHHEAVKELHETPVDNKPSCNDSDNEDGCSIVSLSSSESDTEFVVIPMPKCFNLSDSLVSQHIPHLAQYLHTETGADQSKKHERVKLVPVENLPQNIVKKSETVSQETGVPELSEHTDEVILTVAENLQETEKKICISHVSADGSSSEVSIIESGDNSPIVEDIMPTIDSINIAVSNDVHSKSDIVYEVKYPVPEVFKDDTQLNEKSNKVAQTEESTSDIACGAGTSESFPKFPVEGITSEYEPIPTCSEERTIQVLPEGLVTGALSAAASVYNTARAVISTMQQPRNERDHCLSQEPPTTAHGLSRAEASPSSTLNPMQQLVEMGFCNREQNEQLLVKHKGDVPLVVAELVNLNDNDWYASRHNSSPSTSFD